MGDYGTQNPESVQVYDGRTYFADKRAGKVIRISADLPSLVGIFKSG